MPCVSPSGKPTETGKAILRSLEDGALPPEEIASKARQPLFKVRSGLRDLKNSGFVEEIQDKYTLTKMGKTTLY
jgi:predicted transcriptional regulator